MARVAGQHTPTTTTILQSLSTARRLDPPIASHPSRRCCDLNACTSIRSERPSSSSHCTLILYSPFSAQAHYKSQAARQCVRSPRHSFSLHSAGFWRSTLLSTNHGKLQPLSSLAVALTCCMYSELFLRLAFPISIKQCCSAMLLLLHRLLCDARAVGLQQLAKQSQSAMHSKIYPMTSLIGQ